MANVTTVGFKEFEKKLHSLPKEIQEEAGAYVLDAAQEWEERAKLDAPKDTHIMSGNITNKQTGELSAEVTSPVDYSPYVEWGTGTRVSVPSDLVSYAAQFKGTKKVVGRYPHPFFFIQKPFVEKSLLENLIKLVNTER